MKEFSITFAYNDINSLEKVFADNKGQIAAVIMEPVGVVEPESRFLEKVKDLAHQEGAVLIFDEVKTGFRCHLGGAQALDRRHAHLAHLDQCIAHSTDAAVTGQTNGG